MIINVGMRSDIVACYTPWLLNRLKEGYAYSRNPYNKSEVYSYDLKPENVDALIFCSKDYSPILNDISWINDKYNIFCHYTITSYGRDVEVNLSSIDDNIKTLKRLSSIIGQDKLAWRFDPILLTEKYGIDYHLDKFEYIAKRIHDDVSYCVFSFVDLYPKIQDNMPELLEITSRDKEELLEGLGRISGKYGLPIQTCAINEDYSKYNIKKSGCITSKILEEANGICFKNIKHEGNRKNCRCIPSRDIGAYNTCINGCRYCYANRNHENALLNYSRHDVNSPLLIGKVRRDDRIIKVKQESLLLDDRQMRLF